MTKQDLVDMADILEVKMPRMGTKDTVVEALRAHLLNLQTKAKAPPAAPTASPPAPASLLHQRAVGAGGGGPPSAYQTAEEGSEDDEGIEITEAVPEIIYLTILGARNEIIIRCKTRIAGLTCSVVGYLWFELSGPYTK